LKVAGPAGPRLEISWSADHLMITWASSHTNFLAQENSYLSDTNWVTVADIPQENPTTGRFELSLPLPQTSRLYRLILEQ